LDLFGIPFDSASMSNDEYSPHLKNDVASVPCKLIHQIDEHTCANSFPNIDIINHQATLHK